MPRPGAAPGSRAPAVFRWLLGLLLTVPGSAKLQTGQLRLSGREAHWKYVSKFGYGTGLGTYQVRLKLMSPRKLPEESKLQLELYLDEDWNEVEAETRVCRRPDRARQRRAIELGPKGEWSPWINGTLRQSVRPHIWYWAVSDCNGTLQNFTHRVRFELRANQENGSEFSIEMSGMLTVNILYLCGFSFYIWVLSKRTLLFSKSAGSVHPVIWTLLTGIVIQYGAQVLHTLHLFVYRYDGDGVKALEVLSEILFMFCQVMQTSLLILIALGYTLLQSKIGDLELVIPLCFIIAVIHIMLVGFGKIKDDASYKYHENEGMAGWTLLVLRVLLYLWFLWGVTTSAQEGGNRLANFYRQFKLAGTAYFMAYPSIFCLTKLFAPYLQHSVLSTGLMVMQMGANLWLGSLFLTRGDYFKVSTLSNSDLPGAGSKVGFVKEE